MKRIAAGLATALASLSLTASAHATSATLVAANCHPVKADAAGEMIWWSRLANGLDDAFIGNAQCQGQPLISTPASGHRGPADITPDGRYVLVVQAMGSDKTTEGAAPGKGSSNAIELYDRQTQTLSTLLPAGGVYYSQNKGVIWPHFSPDASQIVWSQMLTPPIFAPPWGDWELCRADLNLSAPSISNEVCWHDPSGRAGQLETYGWIPGTHSIVFQSTQEPIAGAGMFATSQLYTLPDTFQPGVEPTRITPDINGYFTWQSPKPAYQEFANFDPSEPGLMFTDISSDVATGGNEAWQYDLSTQDPSTGLLGQPTRLTYFNGDPDRGYWNKPVPGFPTPSYTVGTTAAFVNGQMILATCPNMFCTSYNAYLINRP